MARIEVQANFDHPLSKTERGKFDKQLCPGLGKVENRSVVTDLLAEFCPALDLCQFEGGVAAGGCHQRFGQVRR